MNALVPQAHTSAMLPVKGPLYWLSGLPWFLRRLRMEDHSAERVRKAAELGPVVYVLYTRSHVDWLALKEVLSERRLPLPAFTPNFDPRRWLPFRNLGRNFGAPDAGGPERLVEFIQAGQPTCCFLAEPWDIRELVGLGPEKSDVIPHLAAAQEHSARPIQVLPVVVIWNRSPEPTRTEVGRFLLGTEDTPGVLGKLRALATSQGEALVQVGDPVALPDWLSRMADDAPRDRNRKLRLLLRRFLYRESRVVKGPRTKPRGYIRRQVLQSREVRELIERESLTTGKPPYAVLDKVVRSFDHIAAQFSFPVVRLAAFLCRQIWNRIYSGIDVRPMDLDRIRAALREGTPILTPCHRSHLDYLLISSLLFENDIVIPHIVAGENLSFFPLGAFFRRCGAFFIKRSFQGDRIHPVVFSRYVQELVRSEVPVEFFLEGGRSRTGKLLPPKTGVLAMIMDAAAEARVGRAVNFLPIYVGYEQIAEEQAYARELAGERKEKESVGAVVKAAGVLRERYGKVYLRVGEPISAEVLISREEWKSAPKSQRDEVLWGLGERILHGINKEAVALPTAIVALAVLAHPRRGVRRAELRARVERIRAFLAAAGVNESGGVKHVDGILDEAIKRFLSNKFLSEVSEGNERVYIIESERRVTLEYYKNAVIHAFAPAAFYAAAVRAGGRDDVDAAEVARLFTVQQFLLRYEFILDPEADTPELERRAIQALVAYGALAETDGQIRVVDRSRVGEIANLTANILESYLLVLLAGKDAKGTLKQLPDDALARGRAMLAADELTRPEALNVVNLQNAVKAYREAGVVHAGSDGRYTVDTALADELGADLAALLRRNDA